MISMVLGRDTDAAHATIERIDAIVGRLVVAARSANRDTTIVVVSDHGFAPTAIEANLFRPFIDAGLITVGSDGKVASWEAMPWNSGGSIAIVLARPNDAALTARVRHVLNSVAATSESVIARVIDGSDVAKMGGNPQAQFYVDLRPGILSGGFDGAKAPLARPAKYRGMHGYFPAADTMRSTFLISGPGVPPGHDLGEIDMRSIAPTLARVLGVRLLDADMAPINLTEKSPVVGTRDRVRHGF